MATSRPDHYGVHNVHGIYQGHCACGWEGFDIKAHIEDTLRREDAGK